MDGGWSDVCSSSVTRDFGEVYYGCRSLVRVNLWRKSYLCSGTRSVMKLLDLLFWLIGRVFTSQSYSREDRGICESS